MSRLTLERRRMARRLSSGGLSLREVARQVSCSHDAVRGILDARAKGAAKPDTKGRLGLAEREEIAPESSGVIPLAPSPLVSVAPRPP